ncbi:MAG: right-handed parallel beta-helix repeat-containing protein [Patescibacteria group bacterium]
MYKIAVKKLFNWFSKNIPAIFLCVLVSVLFIVVSVSGTTTIGTDISTTNLTVSGTATTTGAHYVGGNLTVIGNASTTGTFNLSGLATFLSGLSITGNTTSTGNLNIGGTLSVTGTSTLTSVVSNSLATPANYVVFLSGGTTYVRDGLDGSIDYSNTDPETAIEWAMNNLTSGRTWKEKVVVKGNYTIDTSIDIPSYTILELQGRLTKASGDFTTLGMFVINGTNNIEVIGGSIDGNYDDAGQSSGMDCVYIINGSHITIKEMKIYDCRNYGIVLRATSDFIIAENVVSNNGDDGIAPIYNSNNGAISNNRIWGNRSAVATSSGIEIRDGSYEITIKGNVVYGGTAGSDMNGIAVVIDSGSAYSAPHDVTISGNIIRDIEDMGILVQTNDASNNLENISITGNTVVDTTKNGIFVSGRSDRDGVIMGATIQGNTVAQAGTSSSTVSGINIGYANGVTIAGNSVSESGQYGIYIIGSQQIIVSENQVFNNGNAVNSFGIFLQGSTISSVLYPLDVTIAGNNVADYQTTKTQDGITVDTATTRIKILNNNLTSVRATAISLANSGLALIRNNIGYTYTDTPGATVTLNPTTEYVRYSCYSGGTTFTLAEGLAIEGQILTITNTSANLCNFANQSGVLVIAGGVFAMGQNDVLNLVYQSGQWVETGRSDN